jgi:dTDP-4-dehydrorhamnose reductase
VLITGAGGQLGRELVCMASTSAIVKATQRADLDLGDTRAVQEVVEGFEPTLILNAAAYTAVDKAESEPDEAWRLNSEAPACLAEAALKLPNCRMVHFSTDYVFSGEVSRPYKPSDDTGPIGVYGQTKLDGERRVLKALGVRAVVVRTAWLYGPVGKNFLHTMLRLMSERGSVRVVADQIGCPTATTSLA